MEVQQTLRTLKAGWWIILAALLISVGLGLAYSTAQTPIYEASASFVASPTTALTGEDRDRSDFLERLDTLSNRTALVTTYCAILQSQSIFRAAAVSLGLAYEEVEGAYELSCAVLPGTSVVELHMQGPSPERVVALTQAISSSGLRYISELYEIYELRTLDPAAVALEPVSPNHAIDVALSAILGLIGGVGFLFLRQALLRPLAAQRTAIVDPVTGIANWQYMRRRLEEEIGRARVRNYPLSLALVAARPAEAIDGYPAPSVQEVKRQLAVYLQDNSRPLDLVAAIQDGTFAILMPELNGLEARDNVLALIGTLRSRVFTVKDAGLSVTYQAAVGVVENNGGAVDWRTMMKLGQEALETAEGEGPFQTHLKRISPGPFHEMLLAEA